MAGGRGVSDARHVVLDPVHVRYVEAHQGTRSVEEGLLIVEVLAHLYFVTFRLNWLVVERHVLHAERARANLILKFKLLHLTCHHVFVPLVNLLLVDAQVLRLGREEPKTVE